jgi:hypothetical protein
LDDRDRKYLKLFWEDRLLMEDMAKQKETIKSLQHQVDAMKSGGSTDSMSAAAVAEETPGVPSNLDPWKVEIGNPRYSTSNPTPWEATSYSTDDGQEPHYRCEGRWCRHCGEDAGESRTWEPVEGRVCPRCFKDTCFACQCVCTNPTPPTVSPQIDGKENPQDVKDQWIALIAKMHEQKHSQGSKRRRV